MKKAQRQTVEEIGLDSREGLLLLFLIISQVTALEPGWLQNKEKQQWCNFFRIYQVQTGQVNGLEFPNL